MNVVLVLTLVTVMITAGIAVLWCAAIVGATAEEAIEEMREWKDEP